MTPEESGREAKAGAGEGEGEGASERAERRLDQLRLRIVELDEEIIRLVGLRRELVIEVGRAKQDLGLPVLDPAQEARVVRRAAERARALGVDQELARDVIWRIIASARESQEQRTTWGPPPAPAVPDEAGDPGGSGGPRGSAGPDGGKGLSSEPRESDA